MPLHRRRGRPAQTVPSFDQGTPELQVKRLYQRTSEPLDWLLREGIIDAQQHYNGLRLRWLYSLRYDLPLPRSVDISRLPGRAVYCSYDDGEWRKQREQEWRETLQIIKNYRYAATLLRWCIYERGIPEHWYEKNFKAQKTHSHLQFGLSLLGHLWRKGNTCLH